MEILVARPGSRTGTSGSYVISDVEPLLRATDNLVPVPTVTLIPTAIPIKNIFTSGLSTLTPLVLLIGMTALVSSPWPGKTISIFEPATSRVSRLVRSLMRTAAQPTVGVGGMGEVIALEGKPGSEQTQRKSVKQKTRTSFFSLSLRLTRTATFTVGLGGGDVFAVRGANVAWKTKEDSVLTQK